MVSSNTALALAVALLVSAAVAHLAFRWWLRRSSINGGIDAGSPVDAGPDAWPWLAIGRRELAPPVLALLWLQATNAALRLLLSAWQAPNADLLEDAVHWVYGVLFIAGLFWLLLRVGRVVERLLKWQASRTDPGWDDLLLPIAGKTIRWVLPLLALMVGAPALGASPTVERVVGSLSSLILIAVVAFVAHEAVDLCARIVLCQYRLDAADNLQARAVHTQVIVLKKVALAAIAVFTLASMLMVFDSVRQFGASILASAGVAGIIVGLAAQRSIATMLAGFQIALTQPIRVDDVVIVEKEWGRVEEITLTYVVVRIWDQRRLIVPISVFIEQPFQNWTRASSELLATVFLHVDYTVPVDAIRAELTRILESSRYWDRRVNVVHVTDAKEHTLEIRALASAADSSSAWELRCEIRERIVAFLQTRHARALPHLRAAVWSDTPLPASPTAR